VAALATLALVAGSAMIRRSYARDRADWQGVAALVRREDPRAPVVFMDEAGRDVHRGCLGYYLPPGHRPISASEPGMIGTLSASAPPSLWYVIESAPAFPAVPVPGELSARYLSERTWKRPNVTVVHARIRGIEQAAASGPASRAR